jgi:hypothetical protein
LPVRIFFHLRFVYFSNYLLFLFVTIALQRQTDANWEALFFLTDDQLFEEKLKNKLASYNDSRLSYVPVPASHRPKVMINLSFPHLFPFKSFRFPIINSILLKTQPIPPQISSFGKWLAGKIVAG